MGGPMVTSDRLVAECTARVDSALSLLQRIVAFESPSSEKAAVDRLVDFLSDELERRGAEVERIAQQQYGDLLIARIGSGANPLLVMTHIDTVWPIGTIERL